MYISKCIADGGKIEDSRGMLRGIQKDSRRYGNGCELLTILRKMCGRCVRRTEQMPVRSWISRR